jgi:hypothetical protein
VSLVGAGAPPTSWSAGPVSLTVQFDASSNSYTLTLPSGGETFSASDVSPGAPAGQTIYSKANGDKLTVVTAIPTPGAPGNPHPPPQPLNYVGLGAWQSGSRDTTFDFGTPTPASAAPRTGAAAYNIDLVGYLTAPGQELKSLTGLGVFEADFLSGLFKADILPTETTLSSGSTLFGGGIELTGVGKLSSTDETFTGQVQFTDNNGTSYYIGAIGGRLYGPSGQEVGASFSGANANGGAMSGTIVGAQTGAAPAENLVLTNIYSQQLFYSPTVEFEYDNLPYMAVGNLTLSPNGNISFAGATSKIQNATLTPADIVPSALPNFTTYKTVANGVPIEFDVYKVGPANSELAFTYMDFGIWKQNATIPPSNYTLTDHVVWGIPTPLGLLASLTGTGQYTGVSHGTAVTSAGQYDLTGASSLTVNFSTQSVTGSMSLSGPLEGSGVSHDFGAFSLSGGTLPGIAFSHASVLQVSQGGNGVGQLALEFFGPSAQEAGGPFQLQLNNGQPNQANIAGLIAVKQH